MLCCPTSEGIVSDCVVDSESDLEICAGWVRRDFLDLDLSDVAGQAILNISYAIVYIFGRSLGKHLDGAVGEVADVAGQLIPAGHPVSGESEADALNAAGKYYVLCNHIQFTIDYLLFTIGLRVTTVIC